MNSSCSSVTALREELRMALLGRFSCEKSKFQASAEPLRELEEDEELGIGGVE